MRAWVWTTPLVALAVGGGWMAVRSPEAPLPPDLAGTLVFVSNRPGTEALYVRRLPAGEDRRLTFFSEPVREPALSPDARKVAFSMGGRIGVATIDTGDVRFLTLGIDWKDSSPSWSPDGSRLVVSSRPPAAANADLHLLAPAADGTSRSPLTQSAGLDETSPAFAPDGKSIVFVRTDNVFRLEIASGRTRRLTGGFRTVRGPRFLPSGRIVYLWDHGKTFGIDVMDADGGNRETLSESSACYRTVAPSPDGRYLAATLAFDLGFHPAEALRLRQAGGVRLLDQRGHVVADMVRSWRRTNHSPDWGR